MTDLVYHYFCSFALLGGAASATFASMRFGAQRRGLFALVLHATARSPLAIVALVVALLLTFSLVVAAGVVLRQGARAPVRELLVLASTSLAWGSGFLLALGASWRVLRNDREGGILALARVRGASLNDYLALRIAGVVVWVFIATGGGTLITSLACIALSPASELARTLHGAIAVMAYATAFSLCVGPLAMAALGTRSRLGGYILLTLFLLVPDALSPWTSHLVPYNWRNLVSLPSALAEIRTALLPPSIDGSALLRAGVALILGSAACFALARIQLRSLCSEEGA